MRSTVLTPPENTVPPPAFDELTRRNRTVSRCCKMAMARKRRHRRHHLGSTGPRMAMA